MQTHSATRPAMLLRRALIGNVIFSAVSAVIGIVAARPLGDFFEIEPWIIVAAGAGLGAWAGHVGVNARRNEPRIADAWVTVVGDLGWTAGAIVLAFTDLISTGGKIVLLATGVATFDFAAFQIAGIRRMTAAGLADG